MVDSRKCRETRTPFSASDQWVLPCEWASMASSISRPRLPPATRSRARRGRSTLRGRDASTGWRVPDGTRWLLHGGDPSGGQVGAGCLTRAAPPAVESVSTSVHGSFRAWLQLGHGVPAVETSGTPRRGRGRLPSARCRALDTARAGRAPSGPRGLVRQPPGDRVSSQGGTMRARLSWTLRLLIASCLVWVASPALPVVAQT